jgi:hypothetical protein
MNTTPPPVPAPRHEIIGLDTIQPRPVNWLWQGYIPQGMISILDGDPGLGKSTLLLDIAARVTRGDPMPDGTGGGRPRGVVILSAEDSLEQVIRPRLDAARADVKRVVAVRMRNHDGTTREPIITRADLAAVKDAIKEVDAALVIIDPLVAYLPDDVNANRDQDVRRSLSLLRDLSEETGAAVISIRHLRKGEAVNALYRGGGSIGIIGACRVGLLVASDPDDETGERQILAVTKCNLCRKATAWAFRINAMTLDDQPRIEWLGPTNHNATALLALPTDAEERGATADAAAFLRDALADGPRPARDIQREAREAGIADRTLTRAKSRVGVRATKTGAPGKSGQRWIWNLAPDACHVGPLRENIPSEEGQAPSKSLSFLEEGHDSYLDPFDTPKKAMLSADLAPFVTSTDPRVVPCRNCGGVNLDPAGCCLTCHPVV